MTAKTIYLVRLSFCVLLTLTGCSLAPEYQRPELPVPTDYPGAPLDKTNSSAISAASLRWQDYFVDPQLQFLINHALISNRDLRVTILRVKEAQAAYGIQRADLMPSVNVGAAAARLGLPGEITPLSDGRPVSQYIAGFNASWELDFWGRVQSLNAAALNEYLATDSARQAAQLSLIVQVTDTYLNLLDLDERLRIANKAIDSRQKSFEMLTRRYQVGSGTNFEVVQAETLLTQAQTLAVQLRQAQAAQKNLLTLLLGDTPSLSFSDRELKDSVLLSELKVGQPSELLLNRPDIIAAEFKLKAANANIGAARAAFFPRITLNAAFGGISTELNGLFSSSNRAWMFAPNISLPLFDGGRLSSNLDLTETRKNIAIANYEKTIQIAFREVADNISASQTLVEQVAIQRRGVTAQAERARLARLRYDNGSSSYLEVLDAERDLLNVQQQLVQVRRALLSTRANLFATLGGGIKTPYQLETSQSGDGVSK